MLLDLWGSLVMVVTTDPSLAWIDNKMSAFQIYIIMKVRATVVMVSLNSVDVNNSQCQSLVLLNLTS